MKPSLGTLALMRICRRLTKYSPTIDRPGGAQSVENSVSFDGSADAETNCETYHQPPPAAAAVAAQPPSAALAGGAAAAAVQPPSAAIAGGGGAAASGGTGDEDPMLRLLGSLSADAFSRSSTVSVAGVGFSASSESTAAAAGRAARALVGDRSVASVQDFGRNTLQATTQVLSARNVLVPNTYWGRRFAKTDPDLKKDFLFLSPSLPGASPNMTHTM